MKVFVYGTLKKGHGNHRVMELSNGKFLAECETQYDGFAMVHLGGFPGVIKTTDGTTIKGELYEVEHLEALDALEGYPNLYYREQVALSCGATAWMYLYNRAVQPQHKFIDNGIWRRGDG